MTAISRSTGPIAAACVALALLIGCDEETASPPPAVSDAADTASSSLGQAKDAAGNVIDEAEAKSGQLADEIDKTMSGD